MKPFTSLTSIVMPLPYNDVDTDQIIPASYLKVTDKQGLAQGLFARWRYSAEGQEDPNFPLNQARYQNAELLIAGDNFGCGSSREHAPWALLGFGFRAVISTSFADIFRNNALKNGLLPVAIAPQAHEQLLAQVQDSPDAVVAIDLPSQTLTMPDGRQTAFPIDPFSKTCLLQGVDQLGYLLNQLGRIEEFERMRR